MLQRNAFMDVMESRRCSVMNVNQVITQVTSRQYYAVNAYLYETFFNFLRIFIPVIIS